MHHVPGGEFNQPLLLGAFGHPMPPDDVTISLLEVLKTLIHPHPDDVRCQAVDVCHHRRSQLPSQLLCLPLLLGISGQHGYLHALEHVVLCLVAVATERCVLDNSCASRPSTRGLAQLALLPSLGLVKGLHLVDVIRLLRSSDGFLELPGRHAVKPGLLVSTHLATPISALSDAREPERPPGLVVLSFNPPGCHEYVGLYETIVGHQGQHPTLSWIKDDVHLLFGVPREENLDRVSAVFLLPLDGSKVLLPLELHIPVYSRLPLREALVGPHVLLEQVEKLHELFPCLPRSNSAHGAEARGRLALFSRFVCNSTNELPHLPSSLSFPVSSSNNQQVKLFRPSEIVRLQLHPLSLLSRLRNVLRLRVLENNPFLLRFQSLFKLLVHFSAVRGFNVLDYLNDLFFLPDDFNKSFPPLLQRPVSHYRVSLANNVKHNKAQGALCGSRVCKIGAGHLAGLFPIIAIIPHSHRYRLVRTELFPLLLVKVPTHHLTIEDASLRSYQLLSPQDIQQRLVEFSIVVPPPRVAGESIKTLVDLNPFTIELVLNPKHSILEILWYSLQISDLFCQHGIEGLKVVDVDLVQTHFWILALVHNLTKICVDLEEFHGVWMKSIEHEFLGQACFQFSEDHPGYPPNLVRTGSDQELCQKDRLPLGVACILAQLIQECVHVSQGHLPLLVRFRSRPQHVLEDEREVPHPFPRYRLLPSQQPLSILALLVEREGFNESLGERQFLHVVGDVGAHLLTIELRQQDSDQLVHVGAHVCALGSS
mmetsp:Transcript_13311/g.46478  ORF Transcript_13311/g.46478 Transcript_13311/m.46478 type:complete len:765 (-) Transcript_13311:210-2504(-)